MLTSDKLFGRDLLHLGSAPASNAGSGSSPDQMNELKQKVSAGAPKTSTRGRVRSPGILLRDPTSVVAAGICSLSLLVGCNRMTTPRNAQVVRDAEAKVAEGDFVRAVGLYESALDGSPASAEVHYRLALLYDDKMNDPLNALHHFKRYLTLAPDGSHANDAKNFMKRDELALLTNLSGDTVVPRAEAARLRNENLTLRKQLEEQRGAGRSLTSANKKPAANEVRAEKATSARKKSAGHARTYVIKPGDTLASIARKFYNSSARWKEIRDANSKTIDDPENLKIGETLVIP